MRMEMEGTGAQMASGRVSVCSSHILGCLPSPGRLEHPPTPLQAGGVLENEQP